MRSRKFWIIAIAVGLVVLFAWRLLFFTSAPPASAKSVAWRTQPDRFLLGTVIQGSQVEMSLGVFSGLAPAPPSAFISRLPPPFRATSEWFLQKSRELMVKTTWQLKVEAPDAFFVRTAPKANDILAPYGLTVINRGAGRGISNSVVLADVLTSGAKRLNFWRPTQIKITDATQGKYLVGAEDGEGGYVAVSRQSSRGEVIVLTQSLWWNWIRADPASADNCLFLQNLLGH